LVWSLILPRTVLKSNAAFASKEARNVSHVGPKGQVAIEDRKLFNVNSLASCFCAASQTTAGAVKELCQRTVLFDIVVEGILFKEFDLIGGYFDAGLDRDYIFKTVDNREHKTRRLKIDPIKVPAPVGEQHNGLVGLELRLLDL
jgi:hypothetical protein